MESLVCYTRSLAQGTMSWYAFECKARIAAQEMLYRIFHTIERCLCIEAHELYKKNMKMKQRETAEWGSCQTENHFRVHACAQNFIHFQTTGLPSCLISVLFFHFIFFRPTPYIDLFQPLKWKENAVGMLWVLFKTQRKDYPIHIELSMNHFFLGLKSIKSIKLLYSWIYRVFPPSVVDLVFYCCKCHKRKCQQYQCIHSIKTSL